MRNSTLPLLKQSRGDEPCTTLHTINDNNSHNKNQGLHTATTTGSAAYILFTLKSHFKKIHAQDSAPSAYDPPQLISFASIGEPSRIHASFLRPCQISQINLRKTTCEFAFATNPVITIALPLIYAEIRTSNPDVNLTKHRLSRNNSVPRPRILLCIFAGWCASFPFPFSFFFGSTPAALQPAPFHLHLRCVAIKSAASLPRQRFAEPKV